MKPNFIGSSTEFYIQVALCSYLVLEHKISRGFSGGLLGQQLVLVGRNLPRRRRHVHSVYTCVVARSKRAHISR